MGKGKMHPKKRLLKKYSEEYSTKKTPFKPTPVNDCGLDRRCSAVHLQMNDISSTSNICHSQVFKNKTFPSIPNEVQTAKVIKPPTSYRIPHLPYLEVTRLPENEPTPVEISPPPMQWRAKNGTVLPTSPSPIIPCGVEDSCSLRQMQKSTSSSHEQSYLPRIQVKAKPAQPINEYNPPKENKVSKVSKPRRCIRRYFNMIY